MKNCLAREYRINISTQKVYRLMKGMNLPKMSTLRYFYYITFFPILARLNKCFLSGNAFTVRQEDIGGKQAAFYYAYRCTV